MPTNHPGSPDENYVGNHILYQRIRAGESCFDAVTLTLTLAIAVIVVASFPEASTDEVTIRRSNNAMSIAQWAVDNINIIQIMPSIAMV